jgi:hypothetical protein
LEVDGVEVGDVVHAVLIQAVLTSLGLCMQRLTG